MKTTMKFLMLVCITLAISITSCSKDGDTGPAGPAGINGQDGTDGMDGSDGQDGNANVSSVLVSDVDINVGINTVPLPELTQDIFENGFVIGYVTVAGSPARWEAMPTIVGGNVILDITEIQVGSLLIEATFDQVLDFRFVLVAANSTTGKNSGKSIREQMKEDVVNISNYEEVMDYFGLDY